ncbi:hypothetical protein JCM10207_003627 [Rhodosporidiobolus poonsookiae]
MGSSIDINPSTANIALTAQGSEWLWTCFTLFAASAIALLAFAHRRPPGQRAWHYLGVAALLITSVAYFNLAANLAWTPIAVEFIRPGSRGRDQIANGAASPPTRAIGYGRYVAWALTVPLQLLMLLLATGFALSRVFLTLFFGLLMVVCGLIGALISTRYKFGMFSFGVACLFYIWYTLLMPARKSAFRLGEDVGRAYIRSASFLSLVWLVYPVIWGCSEGGNVITVTSESIAYGILDLLAQPVWMALHLYLIEGLDYDRFGFNSGKWSDSVAYPANATGAHGTTTNAGANAAGRAGPTSQVQGVHPATTSTTSGARPAAETGPAPGVAGGTEAAHHPQGEFRSTA